MIEHEASFPMGGFHMLLRIDDSRARHSRVPFKFGSSGESVGKKA